MATVELQIAGRKYELACRDGEEEHLRRVAGMVDEKGQAAARAMGGMSEARQMLFAALMLADELDEARAAADRLAAMPPPPPPPPPLNPAVAQHIEHLAERIERLLALLPEGSPNGLEIAAGNP